MISVDTAYSLAVAIANFGPVHAMRMILVIGWGWFLAASDR